MVLLFTSNPVKKSKADCLLYANGRTGNTDTLGLKNVGLEPDNRGLLKVNKIYQTNNENIYAVGDVIGYPSLASAAYDQGRIAAQAMTKGSAEAHLIEDIQQVSIPFLKSALWEKQNNN